MRIARTQQYYRQEQYWKINFHDDSFKYFKILQLQRLIRIDHIRIYFFDLFLCCLSVSTACSIVKT